jgi:8-oxo-dGTP pyrophosphatase MutT (NUDIX family)
MTAPAEPERAPTPTPAPEPAREAATVVLARTSPATDDVEVLVLRRGAASRFVPGFVVFPGGSIDGEDAGLAERWFGAPDEAARACAVRELAEEVGLLLTGDGVIEARSVPNPWPSPPPVERLPQIGHWIAPDFLPTRFDARFFGARFDGAARAVADGSEADDAWWARPIDLLEGHRQGSVQLAWPTFKTLEALAGCASVDDVLALRIEQVAPPVRSHVAPRPSP